MITCMVCNSELVYCNKCQKETCPNCDLHEKYYLQKARYYLDMFARGKRLYNLSKKEQTEFKLFMELAFNS